MLEAATEIFNFIYVLLLVLIMVFLIIQLWPHRSFWDNLWGPTQVEEGDNFKEEESSIHSEYLEEKEALSYKKYNQNFKLGSVKPVSKDVERDTSDEQFKYEDLVKLISDKSFLEGYLQSVKTSFSEKIKLYTKMKNNVERDLRLGRQQNDTGVAGTHDSNIDLLVIKEKEYNDILNSINLNMKTLNIKKLRHNFREMIHNKKYGFSSIIGRDDVKDFLARKIHTFYHNPQVIMQNYQNIRLYGPSGIGKSKLAESMGYIYSKSYIFARSRYREYTSKSFTSQYVAESRRLAYKILLAGLEGISFIDEAYGLSEGGMLHNHGEEAITEIVHFLGDNDGLSAVIFAGYKEQMERTIATNEGLIRRIPYLFELKEYNSKQLTDILISFIKSSAKDLVIDNKDSNCIYTYVDYVYNNSKEAFGKQASSMKSLSGYILESIYESKNYEWISGDTNLKTRAYLLLLGFNSYLKGFGVHIYQ